MLQKLKLNPDERVLTVSPVNRYKVLGPGRVWLFLRQKVVTRFSVGFRGNSLVFDNVRSAEDVPLRFTVQLLYRVDPELLKSEMLHRLPGLNSGGWEGVIHWRTEHILRQLISRYAWQQLSQEATLAAVEQTLAQELDRRVKAVGLAVLSAALVKVELPAGLQQSLLEVQQNQLDATARAVILKKYLEVFGPNLAQAMPYIIQWELLNSVKTSNPQVLLTSAGLTPGMRLPEATHANGQAMGSGFYQVQLPLQ